MSCGCLQHISAKVVLLSRVPLVLKWGGSLLAPGGWFKETRGHGADHVVGVHCISTDEIPADRNRILKYTIAQNQRLLTSTLETKYCLLTSPHPWKRKQPKTCIRGF